MRRQVDAAVHCSFVKFDGNGLHLDYVGCHLVMWDVFPYVDGKFASSACVAIFPVEGET